MSLKQQHIGIEKEIAYTPNEISPEIYLQQLEKAQETLPSIESVAPSYKQEKEPIIKEEKSLSPSYRVVPETPLTQRILETPIPAPANQSGLEGRIYEPWHYRENSRLPIYESSRVSSLRYYRR